MDFQYLTPKTHKEFLQCIVESGSDSLIKTLMTEDTLVWFLWCGGTVDQIRIGKKYVMVKVIARFGNEKWYFLGASELRSSGARGVQFTSC